MRIAFEFRTPKGTAFEVMKAMADRIEKVAVEAAGADGKLVAINWTNPVEDKEK